MIVKEHLIVRTEDVVNKGLWRLFPAINCDKTLDIPRDYPGPIGVPITYMDKHDPERFELIGMTHKGIVRGKRKYARLIIRHLHPDLPEYIDLTEWFDRMGVPLEVEVIDDGSE